MGRYPRFPASTVLAGALAVSAACATAPGPPYRGQPADTEDATPPRILAPAPTGRRPLAGALDRWRLVGARGPLPARDGDPIVVTLTPQPDRGLTAERVRDEVIVPVLAAIGFGRGPGALRMPPPQGFTLPRPSFAPLARAVAMDYAASPALLRPRTQGMLDTFLGKRRADEAIDRALDMGEGMTFAQYVAGIERREVVFPFVQVHNGVPIEHTLLLATAWEGESIRSVYGALLDQYRVVNTAALLPGAGVAAARRAFTRLRGIERVEEKPPDAPQLVLLAYGTDAQGVALLRFAYRMELRATWRGRSGPFLLWADAASGAILQLEPMIKTVGASGRAFIRDPGVPGSVAAPFSVDAPSGGRFTLQLSGVAARLDYQGDGYNAGDVSIPDTTGGAFADFGQPPLDDRAAAVCQTGGNSTFQQVSLFSTLVRQRDTIVAGGVFAPFPRFVWTPQIVDASTYCNADLTLSFGACDGYRHPQCPNASDGTTHPANLLSFAHDHSVVGHEVGHSATFRLTNARPADWCAPPPGGTCPLPRGWGQFHDLADFWGAHLESTNCIGGWVAKNMRGVDASKYCAQHDESDWFPRLLEVTAGSVAGDHFPEHRGPQTSGEYADGQIAGAALWQVRAGMRSKCRPSGVPQFGVRFQRALAHSGFFGPFEPGTTDLGTYQRMHDLLIAMTEQWATAGLPGGPPAFAHNGAHTTSKVTAGFARAGLFLVPPACLDTDATNDAGCPAPSPGADAVIDVDDADDTDDDDQMVNGVRVVDRDFLRLGGPAPVFHVWTGPRYRLDGAGDRATFPTPAPCNAKFQVEATTDPTFATVTATSPWITVSRDQDTPATQCYGTWSPDAAQWTALQAAGAPSRIYYRARTRDASDGAERLSTAPGNGLWTVPPPYAVVTADGRSDY